MRCGWRFGGGGCGGSSSKKLQITPSGRAFDLDYFGIARAEPKLAASRKVSAELELNKLNEPFAETALELEPSASLQALSICALPMVWLLHITEPLRSGYHFVHL